MKSLLRKYDMGLSYLLKDGVISFYIFLTLFFSASMELAKVNSKDTVVAFIVLLLVCVGNVFVCSWLGARCKSKNGQSAVKICYDIIGIAILVFGVFVDFILGLEVFVLPVIMTLFVMILVKRLADIVSDEHSINCEIGEAIQSLVFLTISIAFVVEIVTSSIYILYKGLIIVVYMICVPFVAYWEGNIAKQDIFELAGMKFVTKLYECDE